MNLQKKLSFGLLALAVALVVSAAPANAQQIYKATFTLPFEAQWGTVVVEPGEYSLTVEQVFAQKLIRLHGPGEVAVLIGPSTPEPIGENGRLTFVNHNGVLTLKKLDAAAIGQSFNFPLYKAKGERATRTDAEVTTVALGTH